ncbi:hypothetical protein FB567DRAFT_190544 [Paraphoma chrysanthemicola]|uniref:DUF6594 domain-containing protein n=1 Tax=Paraphoma chrysanthemicola TaxID=798071 RepID=A0A8K0QX74_9PLEO|nr:hypothetical protein FB567DRAFT_190544 [Paraphoma chrysanthemicola]
MDPEASAGALIAPLDGYPSLAAFIASDPDHTSLVFKRFDKLAARNLLYLQSELAELQAKQDQFDTEDQSLEHGSLESKACAMNWERFRHASGEVDNEKQRERMKLVTDIRTKIKEYREALMFESSLAMLKAPPRRTFEAINHAFTRFNKTANRRDPVLAGYSSTLYSSNDDLVMLKQPQHEDRLTSFVQSKLPVLFISGGRRDNDTAYVSERRIARFVNVISILLAFILLFVAIISLYVTSSPNKKLGIVGAFIALFAASVGLLTTAKKAEVFAATAAYAAVLVVFVSGNLGSKPD